MFTFLTTSDWYTFLHVLCILVSVVLGLGSVVVLIVSVAISSDAYDHRRPHAFRPILLGVFLSVACAVLSAFSGVCAWRFSHLAANPPRAEREV